MADDVVWDEAGFLELLAVAQADMRRRCFQVEAAAKQLAPVDTGRLRASITHEVEQQGTEIVGRVGTNVEYAAFQEFGTRHMAAHPYLRPALSAGDH